MRTGSRRAVVALAMVVAVVLAACGGSDDDDNAAPDTDTELGQGVSAKAVKIAVALVDFDCIKAFVDEIRVDQEGAYQAFIDDINEHGGINGRQLEAEYKTYCPIPGSKPGVQEICTSAMEDDKVFAVIGTYFDTTAGAQLCVTKDHDGVLITHGLSQRWIDDAPPGRLLTPDITSERRLDVILKLLAEEGTLDGRKVAVMAEQNLSSRIEDAVDPALADMDVERGPDGLASITGSDTTEAQSQLDAFIERWKDEDVDTVILLGETMAARQFVEKLKEELPDLLLISDTTTALGQGRDLVRAGVEPNPYDGLLAAEGETGAEHVKGPEGKECRRVYEEQTGKTVPGPNEVVPLPGGKTNDVAGNVGTACVEIRMFADIAKKVGKTLNTANWSETVDEFGPIRIMSTKYASLHEGKYDADDTYRLVEFDSSIPEDGDWRGITEVRNVANL